MGIPIRRGSRQKRRGPFDLRRTTFGFALIALILAGGGMALRAAWRSAGNHPVAAGALTVLALAAAVVVLRRRRRARRVAGAVTDAAYGIVDAGLAELDAAEAARAEQRLEPPEAAHPVDYAQLDPYAFEEAVAELCRRDGCADAEVVGGAGDLGADVLATTPDGRRLVVQCKRYGPDNRAGSQDLQRFGGTCYAVHGADIALVVSTGGFTEPALDYAEQCAILCYGPEELAAWSEGGAPPPWAALEEQDAGLSAP
ncbi:restriction endonuclease [Streptomyces microflavus]|uniref:Restriction endonuclease n=1 Tax=Streptomyces microflavus TaxID=1919 RepID=A0A6N9VM75_STRMI|nr:MULTISPECIES: restriction endonuclease [Streptomyces]MBK5995196.1 restriction endonuclease [Streptomyces sp. MBT58]MBW3362228.1 restriction endonuclease [Streptomyces sp. 09ZI22]MEE1733939.1 restriction endonuclease [Streptomyces sp. BE282]MEE1734910.1 restriction endonuclease [Streptomyces sp. BE282]NEB72348.1 restriction endonuclease [Streptomyces microflavus]